MTSRLLICQHYVRFGERVSLGVLIPILKNLVGIIVWFFNVKIKELIVNTIISDLSFSSGIRLGSTLVFTHVDWVTHLLLKCKFSPMKMKNIVRLYLKAYIHKRNPWTKNAFFQKGKAILGPSKISTLSHLSIPRRD